MLMPTPLFPGRGCHRRSADLLRRGDFEGLREVPDEYTPDELRDAHNEVVRRLVPKAVLRALAAAAVLVPVLLCAGVKVETSRLGSLSNKSNVVTSVTFDGVEFMSTNSVRGIVDSSFIGGTQEVNRVTSSFGSVSNAAFRVDGAARPLPKYLHALDFDSSYPDAAAEYYRQRLDHGGCSAMRDGGFLYRNFDFPFDDRAEFVVRMSHSDHDTCDGEVRFASVGVAQVGTNLTEDIVTSGKWSKWYKALPGATVDGINENGVCAEINMVDGVPQWNNPTGDIHPLAAVRWALDNGTSAGLVASNLALRVKFPAGWTQNFHYMIADEKETWIVENGSCKPASGKAIMTNFPILPTVSTGTGFERYEALRFGFAITNVWFTNAYRPLANPWISDIGQDYRTVWDEWAKKPREGHRGESFGDISWWQTVHTSVYDLANRVLRIAVQEIDDWYVFQVPDAGDLKEEVDPTVPAWAKSAQNPSYTKTEIDGKLAGKADQSEADELRQAVQEAAQAASAATQESYAAMQAANAAQESADSKIDKVGSMYSTGNLTALDGDGGLYDTEFSLATLEEMYDAVQSSATKCIPSVAGNLASLTEDGDLADIGISIDDVITTAGGVIDGDLEVTGNAEIGNLIIRDTVEDLVVNNLTISNTDPVDLTTEDGVLADQNGKYAHLSNISADDETFSNEVNAAVSRATFRTVDNMTATDRAQVTSYVGSVSTHPASPDYVEAGMRLADYLYAHDVQPVYAGGGSWFPVTVDGETEYIIETAPNESWELNDIAQGDEDAQSIDMWFELHIDGVFVDLACITFTRSSRWVDAQTRIATYISVTNTVRELLPEVTTYPAFSNAVLAVGLNIDTNSVAVLNEIAATFGGFPIAGTATTVGGLLAALAAAVAWLRKRAAHLDGNGFADATFVTNLVSKQTVKDAIHDNGGVKHDANGYYVEIEV